MIVYGLNPVLEALRGGHVVRLATSARKGPRHREIAALAGARGLAVEHADEAALREWTRGAAHQGVVAWTRDAQRPTLEDVVRTGGTAPLLLVLDGIEDPHNVGAILRSADAAGVSGVVRQTRRAAALGGAAAKASAGAVVHVAIVDVVNIARALEDLGALGVWSVGLAADGAQVYDEVDFTQPTAIVVGAEGTGLRRLVRDRCDIVARIPMQGHVGSLNVSVAAAVVLFEALRQRRVRAR